MAKTVAVDIALWLALWTGLWGIFHALLSRGINYISNPMGTAFYFLLATLFVLGVYKGLIHKALEAIKGLPSPILGISLGVGALVYLIFPLLLRPPHSLIAENPAMFFLHFDLRYLFAKVFDITFQQTLIFMLVILLLKRGLSRSRTCLLFAALFGLAHLYLLRYEGFALGVYFVIFSAAAGWIFPFLIARYKNGVAYSFSIHWMFYIVTGSLCWLCPGAFSH